MAEINIEFYFDGTTADKDSQSPIVAKKSSIARMYTESPLTEGTHKFYYPGPGTEHHRLKVSGVVFGNRGDNGVQNNVDQAFNQIQEILATLPAGQTAWLHFHGWSRGAVSNFKLLERLNQELSEEEKNKIALINSFNIDPIPGPFDRGQKILDLAALSEINHFSKKIHSYTFYSDVNFFNLHRLSDPNHNKFEVAFRNSGHLKMVGNKNRSGNTYIISQIIKKVKKENLPISALLVNLKTLNPSQPQKQKLISPATDSPESRGLPVISSFKEALKLLPLEYTQFSQRISTHLQELYRNIQKIPTTECKYYLTQLCIALSSEVNTNQYNQMAIAKILNQTEILIEKIKALYRPGDKEKFDHDIIDMMNTYYNLIDDSQTCTIKIKLGQILLNLGGAIIAAVTGIIGGLIGLLSGSFIAGLNVPKGALSGFLAGLVFGAAIGYRVPKKIFRQNFRRNIKFCLDKLTASMQSLSTDLNPEDHNSFKTYKEKILLKYFNNDHDEFNNFLNQKTKYSIYGRKTNAVKSLEGYLGQHAKLRLKIKGQYIYIDNLKTQESDQQDPLDQEDEREATGCKILEMMLVDEQLKKKYPRHYWIMHYKGGEHDCHSYIDAILSATGQKLSSIKRFHQEDKTISRKFLGPLFNRLSPNQRIMY